uniref:CUB domain-containing protein n=1 Tax=Daphnia galeata TaxID=27404 RepID=A0A8J2WKC7_9CRUS|nr:unnamed protein product [Daphnia galeata]
MSKLCLLIPIVLMFIPCYIRACEDNENFQQFPTFREDANDYWEASYGYVPHSFDSIPFYQQNDFTPSDRVVSYQGRNSLNRPKFNTIKPLKNYFSNDNDAEYNTYNRNSQPEGRYGIGGLKASLINTGLFNNRFPPANTWNPFSGLANKSPISINPNFENPISSFDACTSPNGESGICAPEKFARYLVVLSSPRQVCCTSPDVTSLENREFVLRETFARYSVVVLAVLVSSAKFAASVNAITSCGGTITLNNTFWQSPATISAPSTCSVTVKLDAKFIEQKRPICQVRLDFISFTTAQPTAGTCTDTFQVGGSTSTVPVICGDNNGQHMYLDVPSSATNPTDLQLMFNFAAGTGTIPRSWNIKIAMLPCGASYLAPKDCLQYFRSSTGLVRSFNWRDIGGAAVRQLNNQNYNICFRTEEIDKQVSSRMCFSACTVTNGGDAFSITTVTANPTFSAVGPTDAAGALAVCLNDFLLIVDGTDPTTGLVGDRFCGNELNPNPAGLAASVPVCTRIRPFRITYRTDGTEAAVVAVPPNIIAADADANNVGFCLDFQSRTN